MNSAPVRDKSYVDTLSVNPLPASILNKSKEMQGLFISSLSASKAKGQSDNEATFAALAAVKVAEHKLLKSSLVLTKSHPARIPLHLQAILDTQQKETKEQQEKALGSPRSPFGLLSSTSTAVPSKNALQSDLGLPTGSSLGHSLVSADFNKEGKLELLFDDGKKIVTNNKAAIDILEQNVAVQINPVFEYVRFDTLAEKPTYDEGMLFWDKEDHSLAYYNDESEVTLNIGREQLVRVYNHNTYTIDDGQLVYIDGANTSWPTISLAKANSSIGSQAIIGMVTAHIEPHTYGYVCVSGTVHGLNTSQYVAGDVLYLSADTAGSYTKVAPVQPNYAVEIGTVLFPDIKGKIFIRTDKKPWFPSLEIVDNRSNITLPTIPTVFKPTIVQYNDGFVYDSSTGILLIENNAAYSINLSFNPTTTSSNRNIYFYIEENLNGSWVANKYSGKKLKLENNAELQVVVTETKYYVKGSQIRFNIWGDSGVILNTVNLPGTVPGTVQVPAYHFTMAG